MATEPTNVVPFLRPLGREPAPPPATVELVLINAMWMVMSRKQRIAASQAIFAQLRLQRDNRLFEQALRLADEMNGVG
jgi:hypothetical protein